MQWDASIFSSACRVQQIWTIIVLQGKEHERLFTMQAELERQFAILSSQLDNPSPDSAESEQEIQACLVKE